MLQSFFGRLFFSTCLLQLTVSSSMGQINKFAERILLQDTVIRTGHIGISIYDPATSHYLYNYNADKHFIPASNTKLFTCYAGMKYFKDSIPGLRYTENDTVTTIYPTGDPTFLHPDFNNQRVFSFLKSKQHINFCSSFYTDYLGKGWSWDDNLEPFMVQRGEFPIYGNLIRVYFNKNECITLPRRLKVNIEPVDEGANTGNGYTVFRSWKSNDLILSRDTARQAPKTYIEVPLVPDVFEVPRFLSDTLQSPVNFNPDLQHLQHLNDSSLKTVYSQPIDSLLKPMMYNSDNFFAEQLLLMVSNEKLGYMKDEKIIDNLLFNDFKDIPQQPRWVDGSGLSRYNLFTPQSFVYVINKLCVDFGTERMKQILPTGGNGTLKNYYLPAKNAIYAKTGSLSNNTAISGFLFTNKGKCLIFSILLNNFIGSGASVKHSIEDFLLLIIKKY